MPNYVKYSDNTNSDIEYEISPQRELTPNLYTYDKTLSDHLVIPSTVPASIDNLDEFFQVFIYPNYYYKHTPSEDSHVDIFFTANATPNITVQSKIDYTWNNQLNIITKMDISKYEVVAYDEYRRLTANETGTVPFTDTTTTYDNVTDTDNIYGIKIKLKDTSNSKEITTFTPVFRIEKDDYYIYIPFTFFAPNAVSQYPTGRIYAGNVPVLTGTTYIPTPYNVDHLIPTPAIGKSFLIPSDGTIMQPLSYNQSSSSYYTYSVFHKENLHNLLSLCGMRYSWQGDEYISIVDDSGQLVMGILYYAGSEGKTELYGKTDLTSVTEYRPPVTPPPTSDESPFKPFTNFSILAGGLNYYYCKNNNVQSLINYLNDNDDGITVNDIISIRQISVEIPSSYYPSTTTTMTIAGVTTTVPAHKMLTGVKGGTLGTITCSPVFNDYRDYEPYTHYELYLPYVGNVSLSPSECCDHVLKIYYALDMINGQGVYWISLDGTNRILGEYFFNFGVDIPLSAQDMSAIRSSMFNLLQSELSAMGSVMSGNPLAMIGAGANVLSNIHNVTTNHHVNTKGSSVSYLTLMTSMDNPRLKITHNQFKINPQYGHFVGYATDDYRRLGDLSGYTQCYNVDVNSIHCTDSERQLIKNLLEAGVYL